ncbi:MAG: helicase [Acidimicrobiia bacterium]|nr:MAG: helicase [Acidimicrobiia bacterium]
MTILDLIDGWKREHPDELVFVGHLPARDPLFSELDPPPPPILRHRLAERGIDRFWRHQVQAITRIRRGTHTVVVAGTAAGKTLCYQIPIVESVLGDPPGTSLLLYPTKALAQDQLRSLLDLRIPELRPATYDGDTPVSERRRTRERANVVLTNPDMLHLGILPHHRGWEGFLRRLAYVVVDEMHTLRGVFGSHVALILRRLRRICDHYGSSPTFVFGSATIGNPDQLARALSGLEVELVDDDTSPRGEQWVALWNPAVVDEESNRRRSPLADATDLLCELVRRRIHTIVFTRSRKATELIYRWASERVGRDHIAPYRAGYLPSERRRVERRLFAGELLGVVATNALELGIDVGALDAAIVTTFPGTISAFRQQAGRAGRRRDESLVVLVAGEDALDQYFMTHPEELFRREPEAVVANPANPTILKEHLLCAAYERPVTLDDREVLGEGVEEAATELVAEGLLEVKGQALYWAGRHRPAGSVDIRSSGGPGYLVTCDGRPLAVLDESRVFRDAHPGAVYLHGGDTYLVERLDLRNREVQVVEAEVGYYTQPKEEKFLDVVEVEASAAVGSVLHLLGTLRVEAQVVAYQRRKLGSREVIETVPVDLPATSFVTQGIWFVFPEQVLAVAGVDPRDLPGALHAVEHAAIGMLPLLAVCDRWDLGGLSTPWHPATGGPCFFVYEAYPGGAGISPVAHRAGRSHLEATLQAVRDCPCRRGCPSCIQSPKCGNFNEPLSKPGAIALLEATLG